MTKDEVLFFIQYDSDPLSPCRYCFHTAFSDPKVPANMPQRKSVEVRAIAFFHDYMRAPPKLAKNLSEELYNERVGVPADVAAANADEDAQMAQALAASRLAAANADEDAQMAQALAASRLASEEDEAMMKQALAASLYGELGHVSRQASGKLQPVAQGSTSTTLPDNLAETVRTMAERGGLSAETIASMLKLDIDAVSATLQPQEPLPPPDGGLSEKAKGKQPVELV